MKGSELVKAVAARQRATLEQVAGRPLPDHECEALVNAILDSFVDTIGLALVDRQAVVLRRFGKFDTHDRKARTIRPGGLRAAVDVPARTTVGFAPSEILKARVRKEQQSAIPDLLQHPPAGQEDGTDL